MALQIYHSHHDDGDVRYSIKLFEDGDTCVELVIKFSPGLSPVYIHNAEFPTRYLGGASRSEYCRCTLMSVIAERRRRATTGAQPNV